MLQPASVTLGKIQSHVFNNKDMYQSSKMKVCKAVVLPTPLFDSDTWVTSSHNLMLLEKFHDYSVVAILGISWHWQTTNSAFKQANTTSIEAMIIKNQLRWSWHVVRMDGGRIPKQITCAKLENGRRSCSGQRKQYKDIAAVHQAAFHPSKKPESIKLSI